MSRSRLALAAVAVLVAVAAVTQLGAQPVAAPASVDQVPRGTVSITTADSPEVQRLRDVALRTVGGRAFLVGAPAQRQLTDAVPVVWIPVDVVTQMNATAEAP